MVNGVPAVRADEVPGGAVLLDVREQDEWDAGRIDGSLHVPMSQLPGRVEEIDKAAEAAGGPLYVVCRVGGRSARVVAYLAQRGTDAVNVDGGVAAWEAAGRPLVADGGRDPFVL